MTSSVSLTINEFVRPSLEIFPLSLVRYSLMMFESSSMLAKLIGNTFVKSGYCSAVAIFAF